MAENMQQNVQRREDVDRKKSQKQVTEQGLKQELQRLQTVIRRQQDTIQHLAQDLQSVAIAKKENEQKQIDDLKLEIQRLQTTVQQHEITEQNMLRDLQSVAIAKKENEQKQIDGLKQEIQRLQKSDREKKSTEKKFTLEKQREIVKIHSLLHQHLYSKDGEDKIKTPFSDRESVLHLNKKIQIKNETERAERLDKCLADIQLWTSNVIAEHENMKLSLCQLVDSYERSIFGESISTTDSFSVGELCTLSGHYENLSSTVNMKMEECVQETIRLLQPKIPRPKQKFATIGLFKISFGALKTCVDRFGSMNAQLCDAIQNSRLNDDEIRQFDERFRPGKSKLNFEELSEKIHDCVNHITQKKLPMLQEVNHERAALHKKATKLNRENTELQSLLEDTLNVQETKETELKQKEKTLQSVVSLHEAVKQELDQKKKRLEEKEEETNCKICYKEKAKLAYVPCGHVICDTCDRTIKAQCSNRNLHVCSFCKQIVTSEIIVIFP